MNYQQKMAYFPNLLGLSERIIQQNTESKASLEQYIAILKERADIENQYVKGLNRLKQQIEKSSLSCLKEQLIKQLKSKIERLENFIEIINTELITYVKEILQDQNKISTKIIGEMRNVEWCLKEKLDDAYGAKLNLNLLAKELEQSGIQDIINQFSIDILEDKALTQIHKTQQTQQDFVNLQQEFQRYAISYNEFINAYLKAMESYFKQMESFQQEKLLVYKDTLIKLTLFESWIHRQSLLDAEKLNDSVKQSNIQDVIEDFIKNNQGLSQVPKQAEFRPICSFLSKIIENIKGQEYKKLNNILKMNQKTFQNIYDDCLQKKDLQLMEEKEMVKAMDLWNVEQIYKMMQIHIIAIWNGNELENNETILELLKQNTLNRLLWCQALLVFKSKNNDKVSSDNTHDLLVKWSQIIINLCSEQLDSITLRNLIMIIQILNISAQNKKNLFIQNFKSNKLLQTADFIEAIIIQAIYDGLVEETIEIIKVEERIKQQKLNVLNQLSSTCFILLLFIPNSVILMFVENYQQYLSLPKQATDILIYQIQTFQQI